MYSLHKMAVMVTANYRWTLTKCNWYMDYGFLLTSGVDSVKDTEHNWTFRVQDPTEHVDYDSTGLTTWFTLGGNDKWRNNWGGRHLRWVFESTLQKHGEEGNSGRWGWGWFLALFERGCVNYNPTCLVMRWWSITFLESQRSSDYLDGSLENISLLCKIARYTRFNIIIDVKTTKFVYSTKKPRLSWHPFQQIYL